MEHRLPENHLCLHAPKRAPLGDWKTKARYQQAKRSQTRKIQLVAITFAIVIIVAILLWLLFGSQSI